MVSTLAPGWCDKELTEDSLEPERRATGLEPLLGQAEPDIVESIVLPHSESVKVVPIGGSCRWWCYLAGIEKSKACRVHYVFPTFESNRRHQTALWSWIAWHFCWNFRRLLQPKCRKISGEGPAEGPCNWVWYDNLAAKQLKTRRRVDKHEAERQGTKFEPWEQKKSSWTGHLRVNPAGTTDTTILLIHLSALDSEKRSIASREIAGSVG